MPPMPVAWSSADEARQDAERGADVAHQAVAVMQRIEAHSRQMRGIVETIDGIAFQTNILALNAAVEAARAGESGRALPSWRRRSAPWPSAAPRPAEVRKLIEQSTLEVATGARHRRRQCVSQHHGAKASATSPAACAPLPPPAPSKATAWPRWPRRLATSTPSPSSTARWWKAPWLHRRPQPPGARHGHPGCSP